ncbi:MAG: winged helix-turn-helix domain-containing protein [Haloglomus sp.]
MSEDSTPSPLEAAAGGDTERATEAFAALSNETRLAILLGLWDAQDSMHPEEGIAFSALYDRVGMRDSGQFNYHLDQLVGQFVRRTEDGYALRRAGQKLVRTVIAGAGIEEPTLEPTPIDLDCPYCGGQTAVSYEDEWLYHVCTECEGGFAGRDEQPDGYLTGSALDPAGFTNRTPEELWVAALARGYQDIKTMLEGVCDECSGPVEYWMDVCEDHDDEGICSTCGRTPVALTILGCSVCKNYHAASPRTLILHHPAVVAFYHERGVDIGYSKGDVEQMRRRERLTSANEQRVVSTDPPRVEATVRHEGDELRLVLDGTAEVVTVEGE